MTKRSRRCCSILALTTVAAATVSAGGWVVITVQDLPDYVVVGEPVTLTYAVRQHGNRLTNGLDGRIDARIEGHVIEARAAASDDGYYSATLTLPAPGNWTIAIDSGFGGNFDSSRLVLPAVATHTAPPSISEAERGRRLFGAKGCAMCHRHPAIDVPGISSGRRLSTTYRPELLRKFLAHPPSTQSERDAMPNLGLQDPEIGALVAFINTSRPAASR